MFKKKRSGTSFRRETIKATGNMLTISPVVHIIVSVIHMHMYIRAVGGV